jgi:hypothetical protein
MRRIDWRDPANRAKLKQLREAAGVPPYTRPEPHKIDSPYRRPWPAPVVNYVALSRALHCDTLTAKRWFLAYFYGAMDRTLFNILQGEI